MNLDSNLSADADRILLSEEVAEFTRRSVRSLETDRQQGTGIPFVQLTPRRVGYRLGDVREYVKSRRVHSTAAAKEMGFASDDEGISR